MRCWKLRPSRAQTKVSDLLQRKHVRGLDCEAGAEGGKSASGHRHGGNNAADAALSENHERRQFNCSALLRRHAWHNHAFGDFPYQRHL